MRPDDFSSADFRTPELDRSMVRNDIFGVVSCMSSGLGVVLVLNIPALRNPFIPLGVLGAIGFIAGLVGFVIGAFQRRFAFFSLIGLLVSCGLLYVLSLIVSFAQIH